MNTSSRLVVALIIALISVASGVPAVTPDLADPGRKVALDQPAHANQSCASGCDPWSYEPCDCSHALYEPVQNGVTTTVPTVRWQCVTGAGRYDVMIRDCGLSGDCGAWFEYCSVSSSDYGETPPATSCSNPQAPLLTDHPYQVKVETWDWYGYANQPICSTDIVDFRTAGAPQAAFSWRPEEPEVNERVSFIDESEGLPSEWLWYFGDGDVSRSRSPSHTYREAGVYDVTLEVRNEAGYDEVTRQIRIGASVTPVPRPVVRVSPPGAQVGTIVATATDRLGRRVVVWSQQGGSKTGNGNGNGIVGRLYDPDDEPVGDLVDMDDGDDGGHDFAAI